jgi:crotonobetainyl-CoA:carnitine CoA-transferase CaiB-like acyl-CoA transferase
VVDASESIAGQFCARLLADYGADVTLIEPRGGSRVRRIGPFGPHGESLQFFHLNVGKHVLEAEGKEPVPAALMQQADVILVAPEQEPEAVLVNHPKAVIAKVTAFGDDGPLKDWAGPEIVLQALSGMMNNNGLAGREPLYGVGNRASYAAGVAAYIGVTAALYVRRRSGVGDIVRIDTAETAAAMAYPYAQQHIYNGNNRRRGDQELPAGQVLCRGSWVCIWVYNDRFVALCETIGIEDCIADPRFADPRQRSRNWAPFFERVQQAIGDRDAEEIVETLQNAQVIAAKAYQPSEVVASSHLRARHYWEYVDHEGRRRLILGPPFRMGGTPRQAGSGARQLPGRAAGA